MGGVGRFKTGRKAGKAIPLSGKGCGLTIRETAGCQPALQIKAKEAIVLREYQKAVVEDDESGVLVLHWARQIGKSFALAAWAVGRVVSKPGRLVTVLSNSKENGAEFLRKCVEVCEKQSFKFQVSSSKDGKEGGRMSVESFKLEMRVTSAEGVGRIKVLAANPRTARGFSGDLILDEFAFHEDSAAIWEAAEPILASNPDFKCRIASTGNGKHNMFYRLASGFRNEEGIKENIEQPTSNAQHPRKEEDAPAEGLQTETEGKDAPAGRLYTSGSGFLVSRVTRTEAHRMGVEIYSLKGKKRTAITPAEARAQALDKRAYDQNYECAFADENMTLLTYELIAAAQSEVVTIDNQAWSAESLKRMQLAAGPLEVGNDIGRKRDLSMVTVIERDGQVRRIIAMLKMEDMRLPDQMEQVALVCEKPRFRAYCGDMTGLGLGLVEFLQKRFGQYRIRGINFSSTERTNGHIKMEGRKNETARVTEIMAVNLLACFEDRTIKDLPNDSALVDDLRKPEKVTSPGGRVSIAATRDEAGHADGFWSLALAVKAGEATEVPFVYQRLPRRFGKGLIG